MKNLLKLLIPPILIKILKLFQKDACSYTGDQSDWQEAKKNAQGYNAPEIISKVFGSTRKVLEKKAVFERDSMLFYQEQYNYKLLFSLLQIAFEKKRLHILDFGGALGSVFRQHADVLKPIVKDICWVIVEQESFFDASHHLDLEKEIHFCRSIEEAFQLFEIDAVLFSSVLQYLEHPEDVLQKVKGIEYLIIDRHPEFFDKTSAQITVQNISEPIYNASYPLKIFGRSELEDKLLKDYFLLERWNSYCDTPWFLKDKNKNKNKVFYIGMLLKNNLF